MAIVVLITFLVVFGTILLCVQLAGKYFKSKQKQQIRSMLRNAEATAQAEPRGTAFLRPADVQDGLARLLRRFQFMKRLDLIIEQSGQNLTGSKLLLISCLTFSGGFLLGLKLHFVSTQLSAGVLGAVAGAIPLITVLRKRAKNIADFEKQLPEALDFLSRSMRAGHGFSIALEMLAADSPDPLGSIFRRVSNDLQLGSSLEAALKRVLLLVPLVDVRFFVSSVLLQQETGGNLGEILSKLALIIRERFRLKGQVKAVSAHGRITGMVLVVMPLVVTLIMMATSPQYLIDLAADKVGRIMIYGAIGGQIVGYLVIKKIINIKV
jgi:tight adherence protein B